MVSSRVDLEVKQCRLVKSDEGGERESQIQSGRHIPMSDRAEFVLPFCIFAKL